MLQRLHPGSHDRFGTSYVPNPIDAAEGPSGGGTAVTLGSIEEEPSLHSRHSAEPHCTVACGRRSSAQRSIGQAQDQCDLSGLHAHVEADQRTHQMRSGQLGFDEYRSETEAVDQAEEQRNPHRATAGSALRRCRKCWHDRNSASPAQHRAVTSPRTDRAARPSATTVAKVAAGSARWAR